MTGGDLPGAGGWKKANGGLSWVLVGLFFLALPGFVPFAKAVYQRSTGEELPSGPGWVTIEGYVNGTDKDAVKVTKTEELYVLTYGLPVLLAGFTITIGRLTCGAVPRDSGAKGLFAFGGMFTLLAVTGLVTYVVCSKYKFAEVAGYGWYAFALCATVAEFWFLLSLGAANASLRNPAGVRGVGLLAFFLGLGLIVYLDVFHDPLLGRGDGKGSLLWGEYAKLSGRPAKPEPESPIPLAEAGAGMLGWLLLVGLYWRAVRGTKTAITKFLDSPPPSPKNAVPLV
ncbi:MAG: hypothetical protein K2P78_03250 [Gemmataceae bacterium]|nr:hypothetical protein [Gemmataceae bacterium]